MQIWLPCLWPAYKPKEWKQTQKHYYWKFQGIELRKFEKQAENQWNENRKNIENLREFSIHINFLFFLEKKRRHQKAISRVTLKTPERIDKLFPLKMDSHATKIFLQSEIRKNHILIYGQSSLSIWMNNLDSWWARNKTPSMF